jgi:hypothetical protein
MSVQTFKELFERDLEKLKTEITLYRDENNLWITKEGISNSAGNLCLHLLGNLNHFIGATLGHTGYVRHREDEFTLKNILRQDLLLNIENCILLINQTFTGLTDTDLAADFPMEFQGKTLTTNQMLVHLFGHLGYHLGQINYHRRLLDS